MTYYAHSDQNTSRSDWHLLKQHLEDTARMAERFAGIYSAGDLAYLAGIFHDIGKYSSEFQDRLVGLNKKVDHSTAGAIEAEKYHKVFGRLISYCIAGHHCGLPDWGSLADESSLEARINKTGLPGYAAYEKEVSIPSSDKLILPIRSALVSQGFSVQFLIRFIYSALVDADFLDTEKALNSEKANMRDNSASLEEMLVHFEEIISSRFANVSDTKINRQRALILDSCRKKAECEPGLFTLQVPTGGGKTISSMAFALRHALKFHKDRIIYVVPYTSIIEQNASEFRKIFGDDKVLEHHCNFSYPDEMDIEEEGESDNTGFSKLKLAAENWDMPIIMTTNVQFFESLFSSKSSRCRKLHSIANSVIIMDEAQMIPTGFLKPCLNALVELVSNYKSTIVLCTATQPAIDDFLPKVLKPKDIIEEPLELARTFERVVINYLGPLSDMELSEKLRENKQVLCIVNSKKHARILFKNIQDDDGTFHLSTRMCPAHRSKVLNEIRDRLKNGESCRVVATQLIEAGVDVDFPVVFRSIAGIDSIAQAAGRCNREGRLLLGQVYVFRPEKHGMPSGWLSRTASIGEGIIRGHEHPFDLEGIKAYFTELYDIEREGLDRKGILADIEEQAHQLRFPFRVIAGKFKLIDDMSTTPVIVPWDKFCRDKLDQARWSKYPGSLMRKLSPYTVQVFEQEFREMLSLGMLERLGNTFYTFTEDAFSNNYNKNLGVIPCTDSMMLNDVLII